MATTANTSQNTPTCEDRIDNYLKGRLSDIREMIAYESAGIYEYDDWGRLDLPDRVGLLSNLGYSIFAARRDEWPFDNGPLHEYGVSIDYVEPDTFDNQREGYLRYQLSWGGPSDEFRFYFSPSARGYSCHRVEYWFLDWFDGACVTLAGKDFELMDELFDDWNECEMIQHWIDEAIDE